MPTRRTGCAAVARNAVNATIHAEMPRAFAEIAKDTDTRVVVLTGDPEGGAFCAGGDINWINDIQGSSAKFDQVMQEGRDVLRNICETPQPVIALINGHAMGLGATIALHCDLSYMDESAKIADPHVKIGVVAGDGGRDLAAADRTQPRQGIPHDRGRHHG